MAARPENWFTWFVQKVSEAESWVGLASSVCVQVGKRQRERERAFGKQLLLSLYLFCS